MKNWFIEYSKYARNQAFKWLETILAIIGFVGTIIGLIATFYLFDVNAQLRLSIMQCLILGCVTVLIMYLCLLGLAYINVGITSALLKAYPNSKKYRRKMAVIDEQRFKGLYVDKQIFEIENAKKSVWVSIHSLSDENLKKQYKRFNKALAEAQSRGIDVKVLAPDGEERAIGAYQLCEHYHIEMRFANQLEIEDLRFVLIDGEKVIFSQQNTPNIGLSSKYAEVQGKQIGQMLKDYYMSVWKDEYTLDYNRFLTKCVTDLFRTKEDIDIIAAAKRLQIPKEALQKAFMCVKKCPKYKRQSDEYKNEFCT